MIALTLPFEPAAGTEGLSQELKGLPRSDPVGPSLPPPHPRFPAFICGSLPFDFGLATLDSPFVALDPGLWYLRAMSWSRKLRLAQRFIALVASVFLLQIAAVSHLHVGHHLASDTAVARGLPSGEIAWAAPVSAAGSDALDCPICLTGAHSKVGLEQGSCRIESTTAATAVALVSRPGPLSPTSRGPVALRGPPSLYV